MRVSEVKVGGEGVVGVGVGGDGVVRVGLVSLGCAKNLVDSEVMLGVLLEEGFVVVGDVGEADVVVVNTCGFIGAAQEESVDVVLEADVLRGRCRPGQGLVVAGCLSQRYRKVLPGLLPEVDGFLGVDEVRDVGRVVRGALARRGRRLAAGLVKGEGVGRLAGKVGKGKGKGRVDGVGRVERVEKVEEMGGGGVDGDGLGALVEVGGRPCFVPDFSVPRFRLTPRHFAYVKVAEGCNHPCSFCVIPRMRGSYRRRGMGDVVEEARRLVGEGVRELNLISQDTTFYGLDLGRGGRGGGVSSPERFGAAVRGLPEGAASLCGLLELLDGLDGDFWVRLLYTHPAHWTDELIGVLGGMRRLARYVDMPLQHIHPVMLERMRRETDREFIVDLIGRIRGGVPGIGLRTTFIVGFPGESESRFGALLDFIGSVRFERLGVFEYSSEVGTRAGRMGQQVPARVKGERRERAMGVQRVVSRELNRGLVGRRLRVLVEGLVGEDGCVVGEGLGGGLEGVGGGLGGGSWEHGLLRGGEVGGVGGVGGLEGVGCVARGEWDAPDIDGRVFVRGRLRVGEFAWVRVVEGLDYDLVAVPV